MIPALTILDPRLRSRSRSEAIRHRDGLKETANLDCRQNPESRFPERAIRSCHRAACGNLIVALLAGIVLWGNQGFAQQRQGNLLPDAGYSLSFAQAAPLAAPGPAAAPAPLTAPLSAAAPALVATPADVLPGFPKTSDQPASLYAPTAPTFTCDEPAAPYFDCDPRTDPPVLPLPGWVVDVEVGILLPHVVNELHNTVTVNGVTSRVQLPGGTLNWSPAPRVELGYRLPEGFGEFALAYRFLGAQGSGTVAGGTAFAAPDAAASLFQRLDMQIADLDYASNELSICSWWAKWRLGLRGADVYFDSRTDEPIAAAAGGSGVFERRVTNNFWGIGFHGSLELERRLTDWGLAILCRVQGSILLGRVDQGFFEVSTTRGVGGQFLTGQTLASNAEAVPELDGSIGLAWRPRSCQAFRVFAGYEYEHWWNVGRLSNQSSEGEVYNQGVLLRADYNY